MRCTSEWLCNKCKISTISTVENLFRTENYVLHDFCDFEWMYKYHKRRYTLSTTPLNWMNCSNTLCLSIFKLSLSVRHFTHGLCVNCQKMNKNFLKQKVKRYVWIYKFAKDSLYSSLTSDTQSVCKKCVENKFVFYVLLIDIQRSKLNPSTCPILKTIALFKVSLFIILYLPKLIAQCEFILEILFQWFLFSRYWLILPILQNHHLLPHKRKL